MATNVDLGLHRATAPSTVTPYRDTATSINTVLAKAREARFDPDLRRWAGECLAKAGIDGRANPGTIRSKCEALAAGVVSQTIYSADPAGAEWIQAPHITLCLRDMCIPIEDFDGLILAFIGAALSIGLQPFVVHQQFGGDAQEHVLSGLVDEYGQKFYVDVANTTLNVYSGSRAVSEQWYNPLDTNSRATGTAGAEFVTLGSAMIRHPQGSVNRQLTPIGVGDAASTAPTDLAAAKLAIDAGDLSLKQNTLTNAQGATTSYAASAASSLAVANALGNRAAAAQIAQYQAIIASQQAAAVGTTDATTAQSAATTAQGAAYSAYAMSQSLSITGPVKFWGAAPIILGTLGVGIAAGAWWALRKRKKGAR